MRYLSKIVFCCFVLIFATSFDVQAQQEPMEPFWMLNSSEFKNLQHHQKVYYLKNLSKELKRLYKSEQWSLEKLQDLADWSQTWHELETRVKKSCKNKKSKKICDKMADIRIDTFNLDANQKLENRRTQ